MLHLPFHLQLSQHLDLGSHYVYNQPRMVLLLDYSKAVTECMNVHAYIHTFLLILSTILLINMTFLQIVVSPPLRYGLAHKQALSNLLLLTRSNTSSPGHNMDFSFIISSILLPSKHIFISLSSWGTTHQRQCRPRGIVMSSQADLIPRPSPYTPIRKGLGHGL